MNCLELLQAVRHKAVRRERGLARDKAAQEQIVRRLAEELNIE